MNLNCLQHYCDHPITSVSKLNSELLTAYGPETEIWNKNIEHLQCYYPSIAHNATRSCEMCCFPKSICTRRPRLVTSRVFSTKPLIQTLAPSKPLSNYLTPRTVIKHLICITSTHLFSQHLLSCITVGVILQSTISPSDSSLLLYIYIYIY